MKSRLTTLLALVVCAGLVYADEPTTKPASTYPLTKCVIDAKPLPTDAAAIAETIDGREVRFCSVRCVAEFKKDAAASNKKMDEQIVEAMKDAYPLKECVVSGEKLGDMGKPVMHVHRATNQLVEFCCSSCTKQFDKNPKRYLEKLAKAAK